MKLEQLRPNFLEVSDEERLALFTTYYTRRTKDLEESVVKIKGAKKKGKKRSERKIPVSPEQLDLLRKLGLV